MFTKEQKMDRLLLVAVLLVAGIGVLMVYSSTALMDLEGADEGAQFRYLWKHLFALMISLMAMVFAYRTKISFIRKNGFVLLVVGLLLLLLVFVPGIGVKINGARRWIRLQPTTFQPSEFVKFAMVVYLAKYLVDTEGRREELLTFLKPVCIMVVLQGVILLQPDFGAAVMLGLITIAMLFAGGTPVRYIMSLGLFLLPGIIYLIHEPYRYKRVVAFLDPWKDPLESGFQLVQSFIALGSGGLLGLGIGESRQKLSFLPEINTDFIFSLLGEELGLVGALVVLALFLFIFLRGMRIVRTAADPYSRYLSLGFVLMITFQVLINIMVVTGMVPTKGLPLPFVSYGGSSLLMNFVAVGILLRISRGEPECRVQTAPARSYIRKKRRVILRTKGVYR